jgi:SEC-C motif-containing protein
MTDLAQPAVLARLKPARTTALYKQHIHADPSQNRQAGFGLMLLWRDAPAPAAGREGLLLSASSCANPGCECREVTLDGVRVSNNLITFGRSSSPNRKIRLSFDNRDGSSRGSKEAESCLARVSLDTWSVEGEESTPGLLDWLRSELDDDLRSFVRKGWTDAKKRRPRVRELDPVMPEEMQNSGAAEATRRTGPKVGRNEPCPCGSGRKHKKCCGG